MRTISYSILIMVISLVCVMLSCSKKSSNNTAATTNLSGHAFYFPVTGQGGDSIPLSAAQVQVKDLQLGAFYTLITDSTGLFSLPEEATTDSFELSASVTPMDSTQYKVIYTADTIVTGFTMSNVLLIPRINSKLYTAALLLVTDVNGGAVPDATVIAYTSGTLANIDTGYNGYGGIPLKSNSLGKCLIMQLPSGPVYIRAQFQADSDRIQLRSGVDTIKMGAYYADTIKIQ